MFESREITRAEVERLGYCWPLFSKTKLLVVAAICIALGVVFGVVSFDAIGVIISKAINH